ncbi:nucleoside deaminase [Bifidobacterium panos]|nr:nucleoside deaminase [Bifidobacterium sp. DSM 109963]
MNVDEAMRRALVLADMAARAGDVPVGAVVLDARGRLIGEGYNTREAEGDPLAHAEIIAMRQAAGQAGARVGGGVASLAAQRSERGWNLADCTLVVTLEPCPMCAGACVATHIGRIVFGAWDPKLGACGSVWDIPRDPHIGHSPEVFGGIRQEECAAALADFFAARRFANESNR